MSSSLWNPLYQHTVESHLSTYLWSKALFAGFLEHASALASLVKFCFHLLDAPPHGSEFNGNKDNYPEGCTCGLEYITLLSDLRELEVDYTIIKLNNSINKMIEVFSNYIEVDVLTIELEPDKNKSTDQSG